MSFIKKVLVLKQIENGFSSIGKTLGGICRIEIENGVAELHLTIVNSLPTDGEYRLIIIDENTNIYSFSIGKVAGTFYQTFTCPPVIKKGFAAGLIIIKNDLPLTIAFALDDAFNFSLSQFKKAVAELCIEERKIRLKHQDEKDYDKKSEAEPITEPTPTKPVRPPAEQPNPTTLPPKEFPSPKSLYNDEAVATENYFDFETDLFEKLQAVKELDYGSLRLEDDSPFNQSKNKESQSKKNYYCPSYETDGDCRAQHQPYYQSIRKELNSVFNNFPPETDLEKIFIDGKFVRVNYSNDKFYVVGLIKEDGAEKYICYGVPGEYSPTPPDALKDCSTFIPTSIFDITGNGFWMIFQDAVTGECIKPVANCI